MKKVCGQHIKELRVARGWSLQDLADRLDLNKSMISKYEVGVRFPSYKVLIKLSEVFNCSIDYLVGVSNDPIPVRDATNIKDFLDKSDLHWNGIPISRVEILPIRELLTMLIDAKQRADYAHLDRVDKTKKEMENEFKNDTYNDYNIDDEYKKTP